MINVTITHERKREGKAGEQKGKGANGQMLIHMRHFAQGLTHNKCGQQMQLLYANYIVP